MDIFISWSGPRSGAVANALKGWLPKIVNAFKPWLSSADIDKGARWSTDIAVRLQAARAGIICLTPSNLSAPWILFEAGALSKTLENTFVCPLLVDLEPRDVTGPLSQFQATRANKDEMLQLLKTLNSGLREAALAEAHVDEAFEVWWPRLEAELRKLPADGPAQRTKRTDRELLEELVDSVRGRSAVDTMLLQKIDETTRAMASGIETREDLLRAERSRLAHASGFADDAARRWQDLAEAALGDSDLAVKRAADAVAEATGGDARRVAAIAKGLRAVNAKAVNRSAKNRDAKSE